MQEAYKKQSASKEKWKARYREAKQMKGILQREISALSDPDNQHMGNAADERFGWFKTQIESLEKEFVAERKKTELHHNAVIATELAIKSSDTRVNFMQERCRQLTSERIEAWEESNKLRKEVVAREEMISRHEAGDSNAYSLLTTINSAVAAANWFNGFTWKATDGLPYDPLVVITELQDAYLVQCKLVEQLVNSNLCEEKDAEEKSRKLEVAHEKIRELEAAIEAKDAWIEEVVARNSQLDDIVSQWELKERTAHEMIDIMKPMYENFRLRFLYYKGRNVELERARQNFWRHSSGMVDMGLETQARIDSLQDRVDQLTEQQEPLYTQMYDTTKMMKMQEVDYEKKVNVLEKELKRESDKLVALAEHIRAYEPEFNLNSMEVHTPPEEDRMDGPLEPDAMRDPALRQMDEAVERMHVRRTARTDGAIPQELIDKHIPEGMENFVEDYRSNEEFHLDQAGIPHPDYINPADKVDSFQLERPERVVPRNRPFVLSEEVRRGLLVEYWQDHVQELEEHADEEL
ncbi:uncharacterized protein BDZ99DRAFT_518663 [Mytilinidion resinicola]|uniref:Uncharacterized protein n=1 Tax=Mytilinidion resinicola TaxID=574789 RepID=A0A6A6YSN8_9PEZI|nr:uncharacterized protein BDZ99DRAFT_518663 [Mytilinidion resinicola]KAF2811383.1 hypothetical protein BDZ99DRAFT_518663 [Mytilinidion resinicola]